MNVMFMRWSLHLQYLLWYCSHWYTGVLVIDTYQIILYYRCFFFIFNFLLLSQ